VLDTLFLLPIAWVRYQRRTHNLAIPPRLTTFENWMTLIILVWFGIGQALLFRSTDCKAKAPDTYWWSLAVVIYYYVIMTLPILVLIGICLCLPCIFLALRVTREDPGASQNDIDRLPTRRFELQAPPDDTDPTSTTAPMCAICRSFFSYGDTLRKLPCSHEFHSTCIDRWLPANNSCPLCRSKITGSSARTASSRTSRVGRAAVSLQEQEQEGLVQQAGSMV